MDGGVLEDILYRGRRPDKKTPFAVWGAIDSDLDEAMGPMPQVGGRS